MMNNFKSFRDAFKLVAEKPTIKVPENINEEIIKSDQEPKKTTSFDDMINAKFR